MRSTSPAPTLFRRSFCFQAKHSQGVPAQSSGEIPSRCGCGYPDTNSTILVMALFLSISFDRSRLTRSVGSPPSGLMTVLCSGFRAPCP
ncbi:hypothetical protein BU23DRAFT_560645 [Bimuria novae-zelandiae CBS 107.79]|uniref:Uncharacterized protein n=1 Tax=Bimuria novae-zelandiae CBS 107.79 TaxID=1447943 RepID=A0A6A5UNJ6_9PLEO|nr:hypothetical protein BU23DRAFT_560645 [Bimuria novae-zelandiae CBS 107.79]